MAQFRSQDPSFAALLRAVWSHKLIMITSVIVGLGAFVALYLLITPVFEATSTVLVSQGGGPESGNRPIEMVSSQARVAESQEVISDAITRVGLDRFGTARPSILDGLGGSLRAVVHGKSEPAPINIPDVDVAAAKLARNVTVRTEPNSEIIRISFKHSNPALAADFANAITDSFIARQLNLAEKPGAADFFRSQRGRFDAEVERRSAALEDFARREAIYSVQDQRSLLLRRASELSASLSATRIAVAEKQGQRSGLTEQLRLLKPVTQSPFVSNLVESLGSDASAPTRPGARRDATSNDPPLLMVKVYQEAMVALFKVNSEIAGLEGLSAQQQTEMGSLNAELRTLSAKEAEFERLKRELSLATLNAETYAKRAVEEQINADLRAAKLTNLRVVQAATIPLRATFPNGIQFLILGAAAGLILGVGLSLLLESRKPEPVGVELPAIILGSTRLQTKIDARVREMM
ncbi:GumC family protein [Bosea sp. TAF32]|uniref:GumC family protein n=1 Tax=Bosea sp. TAF32 TaxID=3237482 RepID=UPI003F91E20F